MHDVKFSPSPTGGFLDHSSNKYIPALIHLQLVSSLEFDLGNILFVKGNVMVPRFWGIVPKYWGIAYEFLKRVEAISSQ